ncbi:COP23 domain-containing protein [Phormidium sp. CCY1219]|uniref:COP23 domain-containing protein n=1 Tax=Phormidium sp. CCY1219 TaxID=2886104 RepID=UPI002D1EC518|nr:COP23 domain-containing protein [Phormidium sp. CCY1219]MEB3831798.1 COP23 domain-containing protein [Phormidium sp. CCY1219]
MSLKPICRAIASGLIAISATMAIAQSSVARSPNQLRSFQCQKSSDWYSIRAVSNQGGRSAAIISWPNQDHTEFTNLSAQRCNEVTRRLNGILQANGGDLQGLYLTVGRVRGNMVVCAVPNTRVGCNRNNFLFSFPGDNRAEPARLLREVLGLDVMVDLIVIGNFLQDFSPQPMRILSG